MVQAADDRGFDDCEPEGEADDFFVTIATLVPKGQPLQTILLLVDRVKGGDESGAYLTLDTIDSEVKAKPEKKK